MAEWVSHLIVADRVLEILPQLSRHEFCVGNIAPDCNIPNEDWTEFTPSRALTHWMQDNRKKASDCVRFYDEYIIARLDAIKTKEELSFLLGYYAHLITDVELQRTMRDEGRVAAAWKRVKEIPELHDMADGLEENWDSLKKLMPHYAFYRNYTSKDDVVREIGMQVIDKLSVIINNIKSKDDIHGMLIEFFSQIKEEKEQVSILLNGNLSLQMLFPNAKHLRILPFPTA